MDALDLRAGIEAAWTIVSAANLYVQQSAPWSLAKSGRDLELDEVLTALARALCRLAVVASPFIPAKAQTLWNDLGMDGKVSDTNWKAADSPRVEGRKTQRPSILFPKPATV
jgi:methionyl-tRNA synthetase